MSARIVGCITHFVSTRHGVGEANSIIVDLGFTPRSADRMKKLYAMLMKQIGAINCCPHNGRFLTIPLGSRSADEVIRVIRTVIPHYKSGQIPVELIPTPRIRGPKPTKKVIMPIAVRVGSPNGVRQEIERIDKPVDRLRPRPDDKK